MKQRPNNNVHLHGFVNDVRINATEDGSKHFVNVNLATYEQFKNNAGEKERKYTFHNVNLVTSDPKIVKQFEEVRDALANNYENREKEGFEPKVFKASVDGTLVTKENEKDGIKYYNPMVIANADDFKLGAKRQEGEAMNTATFKGNIANIDMHDGFALVSIATHYYAPGESQIHTGETKPYTEKTSFVQTRINESFRPETFKAMKNGEIEVGDLIEARGQMHNNNYTDKNGIKRNGIIVDLNNMNVLAKKQSQGVKEAEKKTETKKETATKKTAAAKKTAPKKAVSQKPKQATAAKKGVKMS